MKAKIAAMARRLEELETKKMQEVQAISQTPLQTMLCAICLSYEHLVEKCPTIPMVREMFGDCNTYNSNWRNHPNFSWKPQPPQYQQPAQAPQQASNLDQAMVNLSKVVGDFLGAKKSINAQLSQRIDSVESSLNKRMDGIQNDLSQKIDNLQYSISRFANLNKVQEKENFPSQHYQNSKGIHEVEAQKGESSMVKEVKTVITLRSGKEVDLPTSKLEHKVESEVEKEKREEIKGKKKGKSTEKDGYDVNVYEEPQRIVIKEEMMKHMPPPFTQAFQPNSEDFSSEDERLGSLSLGVKKAGPTLGKASDLRPWRCTSLSLASFWEVINFVDYSLNQGALAGHESTKTPSGHESNGAVAGDGATLQGWDEPNARDMGRMTSQPNAKGEMYILNDGIDMKVINFVDYFLNQGAPAGHESAETLSGHESLSSPYLFVLFWMIKIKRNVKRVERRKLEIKRSSKSKERAWFAKFRSKTAKRSLAHECHFASPYTRFAAAKWLRNLHALKSSILQPRRHLQGCFTAVKPPFGTRVPFCSLVHSFHSCEMVAKSR
ncbi:hypothetical protein CK203_116886 [Vitis vinifera]|uniref:Uncharacterized protein n=1 Tax=Vitis vinifera TaxID=29760 RepID=A0A438CSD2_VITVI|nr:hypothetical protein CK203_116886 [Vitis vinifera]